MRAYWRNSLRNLLAIASVSVLLAGCLETTLSLTGGSPGGSGPASVPPNAPPTIKGVPASTHVIVGESFSFRPIAADADRDALTFSISNRPAWLQFDPKTGTLSGTPAMADVGVYANIAIAVSDGHTAVGGPAFAMTVTTTAVNQPPIIAGTPVTTAHAGQAYAFTPTASDPGGKPLTFSIANKPAWATFSTATGALTGTPVTADLGTFANVAISVSAGSFSAALAPFTITVQPTILGSATVSWQPPTQRADGTPLTNLAGFVIYYGNAAGSYPNRITVTNPGLTTYVIDALPSGTYYFVATAYDAAGYESAYSASASKTI